MAVSPSSSVQRARQQLAERLREIRLDAGLTARALSAAAGRAGRGTETNRYTPHTAHLALLVSLIYGTLVRDLESLQADDEYERQISTGVEFSPATVVTNEQTLPSVP